MRIWVNGAPCETEAETLAALIEEAAPAGPVATALNGDFVACEARAATRLAEADRVEILSPMAGG